MLFVTKHGVLKFENNF